MKVLFLNHLFIRTLFIWMVSIYVGWEKFSWIQVVGFIVMVADMCNRNCAQYSDYMVFYHHTLLDGHDNSRMHT